MKILYLPNQYSQQRQREKKRWIYPVLMAMEAQWHRINGDEVYWGKHLPIWGLGNQIYEPEGLPFLSLPHPDRIFTNAFDKRYQQNGNFKYLPGTYIQSASGCWWGKCSFCVENGKPYQVRPVDDVIGEIKECKALGFREVFDDSATFPTGEWLNEFCKKVKPLGITWGCNMRLVDIDYSMLHDSGCRMVLFGVESANQKTLDKINKGVTVEDIKYIIKASKSGIEPHVATIFGCPWETDAEAVNTLRLVHWLLKKGYAKTAQASFYSVQNVQGNESHRRYIRQIYNVGFSPSFWFNQIKDVRDINDIKYLWRKIKAGLGI